MAVQPQVVVVVEVTGKQQARPQAKTRQPKRTRKVSRRRSQTRVRTQASGGGGGDIERGFREAMEARRAITAALAAEGVAAILTDSGKPHGLLNMSGSWRGTDRVEAGEPFLLSTWFTNIMKCSTS